MRFDVVLEMKAIIRLEMDAPQITLWILDRTKYKVFIYNTFIINKTQFKFLS